MTTQERDELRQELVDRLTAIYRHVRADVDAELLVDRVTADAADTAEAGVDDELWSIESDLDERDRKLAHAIEDALRRMRRGEYGRCVDCGEEIPIGRLRLVPWTERCVDDEERLRPAPPTPTL